MEEKYWDQFMATGKIDDYLNYRMCRENREHSACGGFCHSDKSGRDEENGSGREAGLRK